MQSVKTVLVFMVVFALLGMITSTFFAAQVLGWYNSPGGGSAAMCNCVELAQSTVKQFIQWQVGGVATGTVGGLVAGIFFVRWRKLKAKANALAHPLPAALPAPDAAAPSKSDT